MPQENSPLWTNQSLSGGFRGMNMTIPSANQVQSLLAELDVQGWLEFRMSPATAARNFLVLLETSLILDAKSRNVFKINSADAGYTTILEYVPVLRKKFEDKGWIFDTDIVTGTPGDADELVITISLP